ncbi:DUF86 domain-containing protein [Chromatocurvus halotolerans]
MIGFTERVLTYTEGYDKTGFVSSGITYDATLRNLELIGEAATHVPTEVRERYPRVPWRLLVSVCGRSESEYGTEQRPRQADGHI